MLIKFQNNGKTPEEICSQRAASAGLTLAPVKGYENENDFSVVMFYYTRISIDNIKQAVKDLVLILCEH